MDCVGFSRRFDRQVAYLRDPKGCIVTIVIGIVGAAIGAKVTRHSKYVFFQLAEVAVARNLFAAILDRIARLALPPRLVP